jgi:serine/threonine-protein kinase
VDTRDGSFAGEDHVAGASGSFPVEDWDRYEFVRPLGQGGMGTVYEARDRRLGRVVALKFIRGGEPRLTLRLLREARAQAQIDHPNICKVFEIGEVKGRSYIAMQLIDGPRLGQVAGLLSLHDKVRIVRDVALGLHESHMLGVLHRDVKPANILVETAEDGRLRPVVTDFGLARQESEEAGLTESGAILGTPGYISPEQARGDARRVDRRADVYSLGATLYELLAGAPPFAGRAIDVLVRVLNEDPRPMRTLEPSIPDDLDVIVAKCLSKEPAGRYDSARALAEDLDRYIRGEPILGRRPTLRYRLRKKVRRHRGLVAIAVLSLLAVLVASGLGIRARVLARREAADLEEQARRGRELVADVKDMEWFLRNAYLLPLHDVTREQALVRERMALIDAKARTGEATRALVAYALGRGHLLLRENAEARARLDEALALGFDTPELHYARGLALGRLYQRAIAEARSVGEGVWLERRMHEIKDEYLAPAIASLEKSRALRLESPSYLEGCIALYRKDFASAIKLAKRALDEAPWLYEAVQLEADAHRGLVEENVVHGVDDRRRELEEAARLYEAAANIARSDAYLYLLGATVEQHLLELSKIRRAPIADRLERVERLCASATAAQPGLAAPHIQLAAAYFNAAEVRVIHGDDPRADYERARASASRALALDERSYRGFEVRSLAHTRAAEYDIAHGMDPAREVEGAVADGERAAELQPGGALGLNALVAAYVVRGSYESSAALDPSASFQNAIAVAERAVHGDPGNPYPWTNGLVALMNLAKYRSSCGIDPGSLSVSVRQAFEGCLRADPVGDDCYRFDGAFHLSVAEHELAASLDASTELAVADAELHKARGLVPGVDFNEDLERIAEVDLARLRMALHVTRDLGQALDRFRRSLADCYRVKADDATCARLEADGALSVGRRDGRPDLLARAGRLASRAIERSPRDADAHAVLAETELEVARSGAVSSTERQRHIASGLAACARGLAVNPHHLRLGATQAELERLREAMRSSMRGSRSIVSAPASPP